MSTRLKEPDCSGLNSIQNEFNDYQNSAFEQRKPEFFALELCGECGELANLEKKIWRAPEHGLPQNNLADEAADVFIALINYCNSREIHLENAVQNKLTRIEDKRLAGKMGKIKS